MERPLTEGKDRHALLNSLVTLSAASFLACATLYGRKPTREEQNLMARKLAMMVTLYTLSSDRRQVRVVTDDERRAGYFTEGGKFLVFPYRRPALGGLAIDSAALSLAIETMRISVGAAEEHSPNIAPGARTQSRTGQ